MPLFDRSLRPDGRRSSSLCSTATLVVFVALCLLGLWMMTSPDTIPAAMSSSEKKAEVKEEDVSIDATNTVKQDTSSGSAIQNAAAAAEEAETAAESTDAENTGKPTGDGEGSAEGEAQPKNQSFDDENGKTEGGELVKPEAGETDGGQVAKIVEETPTDGKDNAGQDKSAEETAIDVKENASQDKNAEETATYVKDNAGQDKNDEETATDVKDNAGQDKNADETPTDVKDSVSGGGGGTPKKQTFDDENGKLEGGVAGVELVKEGGGGKAAEKTNSEEITSSSDPIDGKKDHEAEKPEQKPAATEAFPSGQAELLSEAATAQNGSFPTQAAESRKEKKARAEKEAKDAGDPIDGPKLCNSSAGADYIPCLDNEAAIRRLKSTKHYEHRERHCPAEGPTCLVPAPEGYKQPIRWPHSRDKIWYHNVPHTKLAAYKGHQNWVKVSGEYLTFPGGGTQFKHGALHYIDVIQEALPDIAWGKRSRVVLDVGCGVASFGGYLFERDVLTMSFAPKDEHEAQVQFALERGIPAMSAVMGTKRLPFPSNVFDVVHCARCRVPWHIEGGMLLLELNRLLRPGGFFVWSATPVYQKLPEDVEIWNEMEKLTKSMCWEMVKKMKDTIDQVGLVVFRKPSSNDCYQKRRHKEPPLCESSDDPTAAWNITLRACMHKVPLDPGVRGARWPEQWPERLEKAPYWLNSSQVGVYGKPAPDDFVADYEHWKKAVKNSYLTGMGIDWKTVRNVMDMRAVYGGFAAALRDMNIWVMNIVTIDSPDTLPIIYERGLFGIYHDWCESFSTYPRSYDLVHADHLFSKLKTRCKLLPVITEVDRILRPNGKLIVRDNKETISEIENIAKSLHWEVRLTFSKQEEGLLCTRKTMWRPTEVEAR